MVTIQEIKLVELPEFKELSAMVDGTYVWFRFPTWTPVTTRAEIFLPLAMAEAMVRGEDVFISSDFPISAALSRSLPKIVNVFCNWNSADNRPIQVQATTECYPETSDSVICCFSGGVDSSFSYSRHQSEITDLLVVMGFDASEAGPEWVHLTQRLQRFADQQKKRLITVETNLRNVIETRNLSWEAAHGSILAAIGISLRARTVLIPSTFGYGDLLPWGSHPLLDPLWSTETTAVIHDGLDANRTEKTAQLLRHPAILNAVQVCWNHIDRNCGYCSKCMRTSLALYMLGTHSNNLPPYDGKSPLSALKPGSLASVAFVDDLIILAKRTNHIRIARELIGYRDRFLFKYHLIEGLRALLGNRGRRLSRIFSKKGWHNARTMIKGGQVTLED